MNKTYTTKHGGHEEKVVDCLIFDIRLPVEGFYGVEGKWERKLLPRGSTSRMWYL